MTEPSWRPPGSQYLAQIREFGPPMLRMRYRSGVVIDAQGFPQWDLLARATVQLPDADTALTYDELRVLDVLTANEVMMRTGDPLWEFTRHDHAALTPPGWTWAHLRGARAVALVPVEAYNAFRHPGGLSVLSFNRRRYGIALGQHRSVPRESVSRLTAELVERMEEKFGFRFPDGYREFLADTNGACPTTPGIHPDFGFVTDLPFFGVNRPDPHQDVIYANGWFGDRLTSDFFAVGYVQGGLLTVRVRGTDLGSVWYWDNDDPRDDDRHDAEYVCQHLLYRVADSFGDFWAQLSAAPDRMVARVREAATGGAARSVFTEQMGASLSQDRRPPQDGPR
ncbi:MAG: SMI1/KNR4 family protein [Actinocatenispora sp.]